MSRIVTTQAVSLGAADSGEARCRRLLSITGQAAAASVALAASFSAGELMSPATRLSLYLTNREHLTLAPQPAELMRVWAAGLISDDDLQCYLGVYGIALPSPDAIRDLYQVRSSGLGESVGLDFAAATPGGKKSVWSHVLSQAVWQPSLTEVFALANRGLISGDIKDYWYRQLGMASGSLRETVDTLRREIPGPSELAHMAVRHVFDPPEFRKLLGIEEEYPDSFRFWAEAQGLGRITLPDSAGGEPHTQDWARAHWEAHWVYPSPTQLYEMFRRLRSSRIDRIQEDFRQRLKLDVDAGRMTQEAADEFVGSLKPFTYVDLLAGLRANDYAPVWRPRLAAIEFVLPTRVDIRRMRQQDDISAGEVVELYMDRGYSPTNAARLGKMVETQVGRTAAAAVMRQTKAQITRAYELGVVTRAQAGELLRVHGLAAPQSEAALVGIDLAIRVRYVERAIRIIRRRYLGGAIAEDVADSELVRLDLAGPRRAELLHFWALERTGRGKEIAASGVIRLWNALIIDIREAANRLANLGYRSIDIRLMLQLPAPKKAARQDVVTPEAAAAAVEPIIHAEAEEELPLGPAR